MGASAKQKVIFWIVAGVISVFFAEVVSGSTPFPFFTPDGWLIVFPVYELHIVLITSEILLTGRSEIIANFPERLKKMVAYKKSRKRVVVALRRFCPCLSLEKKILHSAIFP